MRTFQLGNHYIYIIQTVEVVCTLLQVSNYHKDAKKTGLCCMWLVPVRCADASPTSQNHTPRSADSARVVAKYLAQADNLRVFAKYWEQANRRIPASRYVSRARSMFSKRLWTIHDKPVHDSNVSGDLHLPLYQTDTSSYIQADRRRNNVRPLVISSGRMPSRRTRAVKTQAKLTALAGKRNINPRVVSNARDIHSDHLVLSTEWITSCLRNSSKITFIAPSGDVYGEIDPLKMKGAYSKCEVHVKVPHGRPLSVHISNMTCSKLLNQVADLRLYQDDDRENRVLLFQYRYCLHLPLPLNQTVYTTANTVFVMWLMIYNKGVVYPQSFGVRFTSLPESHRILHVEMTRPLNGSVSTPNWDGVTLSYLSMNTWVKLEGRVDHQVFVSIYHIDLQEPQYRYRFGYSCSVKTFLGLYKDHPTSSEPSKVHCGWRTPVPSAYALPWSVLYVRFVHRHIRLRGVLRQTGFKLYFSFHPRYRMLIQRSDATWNCSVPHWGEFRHHFPCNLQADCISGEDEASCPYVSPDCIGIGRFGVAGRCYLYTTPKTRELNIKRIYGQKEEVVSWAMAEERCRREGGHLASLNTYRQVLDVIELFRSQGLHYNVFIGMVPSPISLPNIYRRIWQHMDASISHYMGRIDMQHSCRKPVNSAVLSYHTLFKVPSKDENGKLFDGITILSSYSIIGENRKCLLQETSSLCEVPAASGNRTTTEDSFRTEDIASHPKLPIVRPENWEVDRFWWDEDSYWRCPRGHMIHSSLACDVDSRCWTSTLTVDSCLAPSVMARLRVAPPAMACDNGVQYVPYSLVCDHRPDCHDQSDEDFCVYAPCDVMTHFQCTNKACLPLENTCDGVAHCVDASDERQCGHADTKVKDEQRNLSSLPPALLVFDGEGQSTVWPLSRPLSLNGAMVNGTLINGRLDDVTLVGETRVNSTLRDGPVVSGILLSGTVAQGTLVTVPMKDNGAMVSQAITRGSHVSGTLVSGVLMKATVTKGSVVGGSLENVTLISGTATCPDTHYQCAHDDYCVPVFTRCNDVFDCPGHEDEAGCDSYQCPGYYRCRGASVCLHRRDVCDGVIHCPQNDDEILCDVTCPSRCTCYGLSFFCSYMIPVTLYPRLRYLDASHSGLNVNDFNKNAMLIYLSLVRCDVTDWGVVTLPNLRNLDLSLNKVSHITSRLLLNLPNLRHLTLAHNPLALGFLSEVGSSLYFLSLRSLDVSGVSLPKLDVGVLNVFPSLHTFNLTGCGVDRVLESGFQQLQHLRVLDLRGCPLTFFPRLVFHGLADLTIVHADNYKLCCPETLPGGFYLSNCKAPSDEVSSCEALLRSDFFRICLSVIAVCSCIGNLLSLAFRARFGRDKRMTGFEIFVANLCVSDFLMGVYLAIIGVADRLYMGTYLWNDITWRQSTPCKVAGFLSLVSSEVSAFIICLITLDRFLVLRFPFSQLRFNRITANFVSACVWALCIVIAAVPLLPANSRWRFYSQTGICIPLPITRRVNKGHVYSFSVIIVLNFVLFVIVAAGQLLVYMSVQKHKMPSISDNPNVFSRDQTLARRLITVAASDFLCWFPIGLVGIMAAGGYHVPGEVNVVMAIFVLPLNSAINPFLYTLNIVLEKLRQSREKRIRQYLLSQMNAKDAHSGGTACNSSNSSQQKAQASVKQT